MSAMHYMLPAWGAIREVQPADGTKPTALFRLANIVWVAFALALVFKSFTAPLRHNSYTIYERGAQLWWQNENMYAVTHDDFRYGPTFAALIAPLTLLPTQIGTLIWMWFNLGALYWAVRTLVRELLPGSWTADREGLYLLLVLAASYRSMWTAQCNMLLLASIVAALRAILHKQWHWAGLWLALPVHVKVWPAAIALLLIACWPRRLAGWFLAALAAVALLPLVAKSPSVMFEHYQNWFAMLIGPAQVRHGYRDAWTIWEMFQNPVNRHAYMALQLGTALVALGLCIGSSAAALRNRKC